MKKGWRKIKNQVLGKEYDLSAVFADNVLMKELNKTYRKKTGPANVLSFPLSKTMGEIFINKKFEKQKYSDYLFIHSLLHLKGLRHGKKMSDEEKKIIKSFEI
jgi:rRNA maturation RNase YbeY